MEYIDSFFKFFQGDIVGNANQVFQLWTLHFLIWCVEISAYYFWLGAGFGGLILIANSAHENESKNQKSSWIFPALLILISSLPALSFWLIPKFSALSNHPHTQPDFYLKWWMYSAGAGLFLAFLYLRFGVQAIEASRKKITRSSSLERNKKTDIRFMDKYLPPTRKRFDPLKYLQLKIGVFLGLDEKNKPIFVKHGDWINSHILLSGRTRCGKGVVAQIMGWQSIQAGELFVVLDPKNDKWMPHIYKKACEKAGLPYVFLDLRQSAHPQINLFEGSTEEELENMFIGAFSLSEKGDAADFYRLGDRKAARQAARWAAGRDAATPRAVVRQFADEWAENAPGFLAAMQEMAELPSVNCAAGGISIKELAESGGCLYTVGDMLNTRIVRMQRMLLLKLMMFAKNRNQMVEQKVIRIFADEFKAHISKPAITALGTTASTRLLLILAMQSFQDLKDCPADLNSQMVEGAVLENCGLQISYQIKDGETAERLAAQTGTILVDDELRQVGKNIALAETIKSRSVRQADRFFIDTNMIRSLPMPDETEKTIGCAVVVGASKLAQFCFTSPVLVERSAAAITPTISRPDTLKTEEAEQAALAELPELEAL